MSEEYGLTQRGFLKKPFEAIKEELEQKWTDIFGESLNLAPETPQGQIIAITAESIYDVWEMMEKVFSSYNIDDVDGLLLDERVQLRGIRRIAGESDNSLKQRVKEQLPNNVLALRDELRDNLARIDGIEDIYVRYTKGITEVYAVGGDDFEIAKTILDYMPPGDFLGNVSVVIDRVCEVKFYRPKFQIVKLDIKISRFLNLECECVAVNSNEVINVILDNVCGLGYGEFLYAEYIKNIIISKFKGFRIDNISMYRATNLIDSSYCPNTIGFDNSSIDVIELEKHEKVVLCRDNISVVVQ